jgi:hypothetical protein
MTNTLVRPLAKPKDIPSDTATSAPGLLIWISEAISVAEERAHQRLIISTSTDLAELISPLEADDQAEFLEELREALNGSFERLQETLKEWAITARALRDPVNRGILLGEIEAADFIEVTRPE